MPSQWLLYDFYDLRKYNIEYIYLIIIGQLHHLTVKWSHDGTPYPRKNPYKTWPLIAYVVDIQNIKSS